MSVEVATFLQTTLKICERVLSDIGTGYGVNTVLTSLLSSSLGMSHNKDLSRRPGRNNAGSMRSGRLYLSQHISVISTSSKAPCRCKNVYAIEAFCPVHLSEHLVHHSIRDSSAIVTSVNIPLEKRALD